MMIAERIPLGVDVTRLRAQFEAAVRPLPMAMQSVRTADYGGWSVTSETGDYLDGWQRGHEGFVRGADGWARDAQQSYRVSPELRYARPTPLCTGYVAEVLRIIRQRGFVFSRVRFGWLRAGGGSVWHRDGLDGEYSVRLHIAVITNPGALFRTQAGSVHIPADGDGYLVNVAQMHEVINGGSEDRVHLFMPVWDIDGASRHFRLPASKRPQGLDKVLVRQLLEPWAPPGGPPS
jgi:hypothetical protein